MNGPNPGIPTPLVLTDGHPMPPLKPSFWASWSGPLDKRATHFFDLPGLEFPVDPDFLSSKILDDDSACFRRYARDDNSVKVADRVAADFAQVVSITEVGIRLKPRPDGVIRLIKSGEGFVKKSLGINVPERIITPKGADVKKFFHTDKRLGYWKPIVPFTNVLAKKDKAKLHLDRLGNLFRFTKFPSFLITIFDGLIAVALF
ncbi:MAG: hypothetical protein WCJ40_01900 [Planctomycetota bacterium]